MELFIAIFGQIVLFWLRHSLHFIFVPIRTTHELLVWKSVRWFDKYPRLFPILLVHLTDNQFNSKCMYNMMHGYEIFILIYESVLPINIMFCIFIWCNQVVNLLISFFLLSDLKCFLFFLIEYHSKDLCYLGIKKGNKIFIL